MKFEKRSVTLHGGRIVHILIPFPQHLPTTLIALDDTKGTYYTFGNGTGYKMLADFFAISMDLEANELLYVPLAFKHLNDFKNQRPGMSPLHFSKIVLVNYSQLPISAKDIQTALKTKVYQSQTVKRLPSSHIDYVDFWKTDYRLTVKPSGKALIFSTNKDVFKYLAWACQHLVECGDDESLNYGAPHSHHDWDENTSASVGITFYYWQPPHESVNLDV